MADDDSWQSHSAAGRDLGNESHNAKGVSGSLLLLRTGEYERVTINVNFLFLLELGSL
jgi:hypothetical protein